MTSLDQKSISTSKRGSYLAGLSALAILLTILVTLGYLLSTANLLDLYAADPPKPIISGDPIWRTIGGLYLVILSLLILIGGYTSIALTWRGGTRSSWFLGLFVMLVVSFAFMEFLERIHIDPAGKIIGLFVVMPAIAFHLFCRTYEYEIVPSNNRVPVPDRREILIFTILSCCSFLVFAPKPWDILAITIMFFGILLAPYLIIRGLRMLRSIAKSTSPEVKKNIAWVMNGFSVCFFMALLWISSLFGEGVLVGLQADRLGIEEGIGDESILIVHGKWYFLIEPLVLILINFVLIVFIALSVFYKGSVDSELVLRKTTLYGVLGIIFVFLFAGIEGLISNYVDRLISLPTWLGTFVTGGLSALIVLPLHGKVRKFSEKILPKG